MRGPSQPREAAAESWERGAAATSNTCSQSQRGFVEYRGLTGTYLVLSPRAQIGVSGLEGCGGLIELTLDPHSPKQQKRSET